MLDATLAAPSDNVDSGEVVEAVEWASLTNLETYLTGGPGPFPFWDTVREL